MPPLNSTSRIRPLRSLDGFGRGAQQGAGRFRLGGTCRCLAVVRVLGPACSGAPLGLFGGFRSRKAQPPRPGCLLGSYWGSRARCANEISTAFYLTQNLRADFGHTRPGLQSPVARRGCLLLSRACRLGSRCAVRCFRCLWVWAVLVFSGDNKIGRLFCGASLWGFAFG